jgi:hypothetical protein
VHLIDQIQDLPRTGDILDSGEGDLGRIYLIESVDLGSDHPDVGIDGDHRIVGVIVDVEEGTGLDIGVDEEVTVGVFLPKLIQMLELMLGAVEIVIGGYTYHFTTIGMRLLEYGPLRHEKLL